MKFFNEPLTEENVRQVKDIEVLSVFLNSNITKKIFGKLPKLKLIVTRSTGFDHIDLNEAKKRKVMVCNRPVYGENTVAEHTFALILALSRKVHKSYLRAQQNDFSMEGLEGFDLEGKTIGVVGAGNIGKHVIRIAKGFNMKVIVHDLHPDKFLAEEMDFQYVSFETILKKSDIVTIHIPYNKNNHHLFNKNVFGKMKRGSILINTARGGIVDTEALIKALETKHLSGVGLDVLEGEELIKEEKELLYEPKKIKALEQLVEDHILISKDNVVFTPHIAFYSKEALHRIIENTIKNIKDFKKGKVEEICKVY